MAGLLYAGPVAGCVAPLSPPPTIHERIFAHAEARGDAPFAIVSRAGEHVTLTYRGLAEKSASYASSYASRGVRAGDSIAIVLPQCADQYPAFIGALLLGAIPAFLPTPSVRQDPEIFWQIQSATLSRMRAKVMVVETSSSKELAARMPGHETSVLDVSRVSPGTVPARLEISEDEVAFLQHSSGTTGLKKGVELSHRAVLSQIDAYSDALGIGDADRIATWLPHYHDMGLVACFLLPAVLGLSVVCLDPFEWVLEPTRLLDVIDEYECTLAWLPNFAFHHILRAPRRGGQWRLQRMRAFIDCSEPCKPETLERFRDAFSDSGLQQNALHVCYAMAENVFAVTQTSLQSKPPIIEVDGDALRSEKRVRRPSSTERAVRLVSCGKPIATARVAIRSDDGTLAAEGSVGEILVGGSTLFSGYHGATEPPDTLQDGWYTTGDVGFVQDGELYVVGRTDDLIIVNGRNLYAHDVEHIVNLHSSVKPGRAVALGVWSETKGSHELVLVVETPGGVSDLMLRRRISDVVSSATGATVSVVRFVEPGWLVKTTSGKISREANLAKYVADQPPML